MNAMNLSLKPQLKKFVENQVKTGRYESIDQVLAAGVARLMQDDGNDDFAPGELQKLVDEGEADIARGNFITLAQARKHFERRRKQAERRKTSPKSRGRGKTK
jgi:putative addiction module CopG family antidote